MEQNKIRTVDKLVKILRDTLIFSGIAIAGSNLVGLATTYDRLSAGESPTEIESVWNQYPIFSYVAKPGRLWAYDIYNSS